MPEKATKKARRPMTAVRMWKVSSQKVEALSLDDDALLADYIDILKDEALEEMAAK